MNDIFGYMVNYGIPIGILLVVLVVIVVAIGATITWYKYIVYGYLLIVLLVAQANSFGTLDRSSGFSAYFWVKGTKSFFFSFLDMALFGTWLLGVVLLSFWQKKDKQFVNPLAKWYLAFGALFLGYVLFAFIGNTPLLLEFTPRGVINILWQGMFVSLLFATLRTEREIKTLLFIIIVCVGGREIFGFIRYIFFGGDPRNYYANFQNLNVKMTFSDINDSILASFMMGFASWKLLVDRNVKWESKFGYSALALMALLTPILTSRRTLQGGALLSLVLLIFLLPRGRRAPILIVLALVIPLALSALALRTADSNVPILQKILIDVKTDKNADPREDRFYELRVAWETVREEPFFGVGPSGSFKVASPVGLYYHGGVYDFVHSGFGHVLLKTGFVGLFIFISIFVTYLLHLKKGWVLVLPEHKGLVVGALCGFIAQIPNMLTGTAVPEIRTMQVGGLLFAVPLICIAIGRKKRLADKSELNDKKENLSYFSPTLPMKINRN